VGVNPRYTRNWKPQPWRGWILHC